MRDQFKAYCTRLLRENAPQFRERPIWSCGGDWKYVHSDGDLANVVLYAGAVQDAKYAGT